MMFTFNEGNAHCFNKGHASVTIDGDGAVFSGPVHGMPNKGGDERRSAAIEGWFELKDRPVNL